MSNAATTPFNPATSFLLVATKDVRVHGRTNDGSDQHQSESEEMVEVDPITSEDFEEESDHQLHIVLTQSYSFLLLRNLCAFE